MTFLPRFLAVAFGLLLCAGPGRAAEPAKAGSYHEPMSLAWGKVTDAGGSTRETWYAVKKPTFADDEVFTPQERALLAASWERVASAQAGGQPVWRVDRVVLTKFYNDVNASAVFALTQMASPPPPRAKGGAGKRKWALDFEWSRPALAAAGVEVALVAKGVAPGVALRVPLAEALGQSEVAGYARIETADRAAIAAAADWVDVFLVAPGTLAEGKFPEVTDASEADLARFAIPIAYGLCALRETLQVFGSDAKRPYSPESIAAIKARLNGSKPFAGSDQWFPYFAQAGALDRAEIINAVGESPVRLAYPDTNGDFRTPRVQPENEWAIIAGPFPFLERVQAKVTQIRGKEKVHPRADLEKLLPNPEDRRQYERDIAKVEAAATRAVELHSVVNHQFYWYERVKENHARTMREVEDVRFTDGWSAVFEADGVTYTTTYAPAHIEGSATTASHDPERGAGATYGLKWSGLLHPSDSFNFAVEVTEHSATGSGEYRFMKIRDLERRKFLWLSLKGSATEDKNFFLRDVSTQAFENRTLSGGIEAEYDVTPKLAAGRKLEPWTAKFTAAVLMRGYRLREGGLAAERQERGLVLQHGQTWRFFPATADDAAVAWEPTLGLTVDLAPRVGWDKAFATGELAGALKAKFGGKPGQTDDAMYAVLRTTAAGSAGELPLAYRFRFGEADRMRGLDPGEFSGRAYLHGELKYGVNLGYAFGKLFPPAAPKPGENPNPGSQVPPLLRVMALELIAEQGSIGFDRQWPGFGADYKGLTSYALSLSKEATEGTSPGVDFGYAWSPQGLRTNGRFFMNAKLKF